MQFGHLLRKARKLAGLTQEQMADKMNISRTNVSKLERDQIELKATDMIKWFQFTNMQELAALTICGLDPLVLSNLMSQITQLLGGLILLGF